MGTPTSPLPELKGVRATRAAFYLAQPAMEEIPLRAEIGKINPDTPIIDISS